MHDELDLPEFLRRGWEYARDRTPIGLKSVQVRLSDGRVKNALYSESTGEWIEEILGRQVGALENVVSWRSLRAVRYKFDWTSLELASPPEELHHDFPHLPATGTEVSLRPKESVTVVTEAGEDHAREVAKEEIERWASRQ